MGSRQRRNLTEGVCQGAIWLRPELAHPIEMGAAALSSLAREAERIQRDAARLCEAAETGENVPSLTLTVDLALAGVDTREAFARELTAAVEAVVRRYHVANGDEPLRLAVVSYPTGPRGERGA